MPGEGALVLYNNSSLLAYIRSYSPDLTETDRRVTFTAPFVFAAGGRRTHTHTRDVIKNWPRNKTRCAVVGGGGGRAGTAGSTGCFDPAARRASHRRHSRQMARQS